MGSSIRNKKVKKDFAPQFESALDQFEENGDALLINIIYRLVEYWNTYRLKKKGRITLSMSD